MRTLDIGDVLDVEYPGPPEWADDGERLAATIYEDDGAALLVAHLDDASDDRSVDRSEDDPPVKDQPADAAPAVAPWVDRNRPGDGHVADFAWRPGTAQIAVTTDDAELFLVDAADGTSRILAEAADGFSAPTWGPDGEWLACYRDDRPVVRSVETGVERALDVPANDRFLTGERPLAWNDAGDRLAVQFVDRETTQVAVVDVPAGDEAGGDVPAGELAWRTTDLAATDAPAWLADGRLMLDRRRDDGTVREVVAVDTDGGVESVLAEEVDRDCGTVSGGAPEVSPDGTRIALALPLSGWEHVHVVDVASGTRRQLTDGEFADKGLAGSTPRWVDDDTLVFASNRRGPGERQLFAVDVGDGAVSPVVESAGTNVRPAPSPDGTGIAYVHADRTRSPELRVSALEGGGGPAALEGGRDPVRVSRSVVEEWPVEPIEPEPVSFESHDGTTVHGYLLDPRGHGVDADATGLPALVWVHGGPMRQMRDGWHPSRSYGLAYAAHQYFARRGYVGLLVNYRGGIGYGAAFRKALADGYGRDEMRDVVAGAEYLKGREYVDPGSVGVWGLSYGGYATLQLLGTQPDAFALGVSIAGLADLRQYEEWAAETKFPAVTSSQSVVFGGTPWDAPERWDEASPVTHMDDYESPLYTFHGTGDRYVDVGQQDVVVDRLLDRDAEFEAEYYPDESHVFARRAVWRRTLRTVEAALDRHL